MEYYRLKMKALPRISFAATNSVSTDGFEEVNGNDYSMVRYVDAGAMEVTLKGREKVLVKSGEYFITPANVPDAYDVRGGSTITMFSFYLDAGVEELVRREEIRFEHSDNFVYVDIESLFIPVKGKIVPSERAYYALKQLVSEYDRIGEYVNVCASVKVMDFFLTLAMRNLEQLKPTTGRVASARAYSYCDRIDEYVEKNYAQPITMTTISNLLVMHENYVSRVYKRIRGTTVMQHLRDVRIEKAKKLLVSDRYTIPEISRKVGFRDPKYFISTFKKIERVSPGKYYDAQLDQRKYTYDPPDFIDPEEEEY